MTYVVRRPQNRWEIRESLATPDGPRARTLATFRELNLEVLELAEGAASTTFDRDRVIESARRAGAPVAESRANAATRTLIAELAAGRAPSPGLVALLQSRLADVPSAHLDEGDSIADWFLSSDHDRGIALRDLLELADALPRTRRTVLEFPTLHRRNA